MNGDQELWACALAIEREHGEGAFLHAAIEIDRLDAEGEREAAGVWREVLKRIEALEAREGNALALGAITVGVLGSLTG